MPDWRDPRLWALAVPVVVIAGLAAWALAPLGGEHVLLQTRPVDPTDLFRGDYATLRYQVATLGTDIPGASALQGMAEGADVYVALEPKGATAPTGDPYWVVTRVDTRPVSGEGVVCMHGTLHRSTATYGIEAYFVQKDEDFSDWRGKTVSVDVAVKDCTARVAGIVLDDKPWDG